MSAGLASASLVGVGAAGSSSRSSAAAELKAGYRAARGARSFEVSWSPLIPALDWVIQTRSSTRAVERFTVGAPVGYIYTLLSPRRACFWNEHGAPTASAAQCGAESLATYNAEVFPFLDLTRPVLVGTRRIHGTPAEGVRGHLVMRTREGASTSTFSVGLVTAWFATRGQRPLAITCSSSQCAGVSSVVTFLDWNGRSVRFPPGTPRPGGPTSTGG